MKEQGVFNTHKTQLFFACKQKLADVVIVIKAGIYVSRNLFITRKNTNTLIRYIHGRITYATCHYRFFIPALTQFNVANQKPVTSANT